MRLLLLVALLAALLPPLGHAQRLTRERLFPGLSTLGFGQWTLTPSRDVLTYTGRRNAQNPQGFDERALFLTPQLDTLSTPQRLYRLAPGIPKQVPAGGYAYAYGEPSLVPADVQDVTLRRYSPDLRLRWLRRFDPHPGYEDLPTDMLAAPDGFFIKQPGAPSGPDQPLLILP